MFYFLKRPFFHKVKLSFGKPLVFITHTSQPFSEFHVCMFHNGERREELRKTFHDVLQGYWLCVVRRVLRGQIGERYHLLVILYLLEFSILSDDACIVLVFEPVLSSFVQFLVELGIELVVVDDARVVNLVGIDADEAARTGGVGEWAPVVGGGNSSMLISA